MDSASEPVADPQGIPGRQEAVEAMDGIRDALYELLGKDFAHVSLIVVQPVPAEGNIVPDPNSAAVCVRHLSFGGINPSIAHMLSVKALLNYGAQHFSEDADPALISQIFGANIKMSGRGGMGGGGNTSGGGKILRP